MKTELKEIKVLDAKDIDVIFERTDGTKIYKINAHWDALAKAWFQWGAPKEVLTDNVQDVQKYYYQKHSFNFMPGRANANTVTKQN